MKRCPITYEPCEHQDYSARGLKLLSSKLKHLNRFPFTPKEQIQRAIELAAKLSIQGVQPKLSARLNFAEEVFEIVEKGGTFILKPPHLTYDEVPQNEDLTMRLARAVNIDIPLHGMLYNIDGSLTYFIKRFDRMPGGQKIAVEDFSQLLGYTRDTKYDASMEKVASVIEKHCTFPIPEKLKLFRLTIFNFLTGNEDMHLKNFSLIRRGELVEMSPAYDLLNTTLVIRADEEMALPLRGKKSRLTRADLVDYFGEERLGLQKSVLRDELDKFQKAINLWNELLSWSFLSPSLRDSYATLIESRWKRIG